MRVMLTALVLLAIPGPALAEDPTYRLDLSTRQNIGTLLDVDRPLKSGLRLNVETQSDRVLIRGRSNTSEIKLSIALIHPSQATDGMQTVAGAAILTKPGPALADDVAEVVTRLKRTGREIAWTLPNEAPTEAPRKEDDPRFTNLAWLSVAGFGLLVAAFWHHRRRMNGEIP